MKIYVTKYALTKGILELQGRECSKGMCEAGNKYPNYFHGDEWHTDLEEAKANARHRRDKRVASLKKQLEKLQKMEF